MARLDNDVPSSEVKAILQENFKLAEALGFNGTPNYLIGDEIIIQN